MRRKAALMTAGLAAAATMAIAPPAAAQALCVGEHSIFALCVDPSGSSRTICVYAGPPPCTPVTIPIPTAWCEGALLSC